MGCDIHLFAEKKVRPKWWKFWEKQKWVSIDKWSRNEDYPEWSKCPIEVKREDRIYTDGRNYNLFCALAGIRSSSFFGEPPIISEPKGMPMDCCHEIQDECKSWDTDGHSHSWLTTSELNSFDWSSYGRTCEMFINEVLPKLSKHKEARIVFWFDN